MEAIQKKKTLEEAFKELWLKYASYDKCLEELKNIGFNIKKDYLISLRYELKLPRMYEILLHNKKCVYCGKNAEMFSYKFSSTSIPIFLCKKCYLKIYNKRYHKKYYEKYYKKHRIKILKSWKRRIKEYIIYLGAIECQKCLNHGLLYARFIKIISTKHIVGPFFYVAHQYCINGKKHSTICYIGRNEDLEKRVPPYLLECNCKKCRMKRGEIIESNIEAEEERI